MTWRVCNRRGAYLLNNYDKIYIVGDFNYPSVRWDGDWSNNKDNEFVECVRDVFSDRR